MTFTDKVQQWLALVQEISPRFNEVTVPGIDLSTVVAQQRPAENIRLPAQVLELYRIFNGTDMTLLATNGVPNLVPDASIFYGYHFISVDAENLQFSLDYLGGIPYFILLTDNCGSNFLARADGASDMLYNLAEGAEILLPAFRNTEALFDTVLALLSAGEFFYAVEQDYVNLITKETAWEFARRFNRNLAYWEAA